MSKPLVVLLHGIKRSHIDMLVLENRLKKEGYDTLNIQYPSTKHNIDYLSDYVYGKISEDARYHSTNSINFIAHSMGGLVTRHVIHKHRPQNLGKVVMLGTPNKGSEMADFLSDNSILSRAFKLLFGPAGHELRTDQERIDGGIIDYTLGVIASDISLNPIGKRVFGEANDTLVSIESTKIEGMTDHIILNSTHTIMMFDPRVVDQTIMFLKTGKFDHKKKIAFIPEGPEDFHP